MSPETRPPAAAGDETGSDVCVQWLAFLRADGPAAVDALVSRLAETAGVELELLAAEPHWKDHEIQVADLRHTEPRQPTPDLLWTVLRRAQRLGGPWTVLIPADDDFEIIASLQAGGRLTVPGVEMLALSTGEPAR